MSTDEDILFKKSEQTEPNSVWKGPRRLLQECKVGLKFENQYVSSNYQTRKEKQSNHLYICRKADHWPLPMKAGSFTTIQYFYPFWGQFAVHSTEVFWILPFSVRVMTFQTECCLFTLELLSTNWAALCWLVESGLCATVQVTIESGISLCSSKVSTSEKEAPFSWVSPPYILQVAWPYVSQFHCII